MIFSRRRLARKLKMMANLSPVLRFLIESSSLTRIIGTSYGYGLFTFNAYIQALFMQM